MNEAYLSLKSMIGKTEADAAIRDYLQTGGQNLDPMTTAWCAAAVNSALEQGGSSGTGRLNARSFLDWGESVDEPQPGDIAVFSRGDPNGWQGHVGFFDGYNEDGSIRVLGGNQGDAVSIASYPADRLLGFRRDNGTYSPGTYSPTDRPLTGGAGRPPALASLARGLMPMPMPTTAPAPQQSAWSGQGPFLANQNQFLASQSAAYGTAQDGLRQLFGKGT